MHTHHYAHNPHTNNSHTSPTCIPTTHAHHNTNTHTHNSHTQLTHTHTHTQLTHTHTQLTHTTYTVDSSSSCNDVYSKRRAPSSCTTSLREECAGGEGSGRSFRNETKSPETEETRSTLLSSHSFLFLPGGGGGREGGRGEKQDRLNEVRKKSTKEDLRPGNTAPS